MKSGLAVVIAALTLSCFLGAGLAQEQKRERREKREERKEKKAKVREQEAVISSVGQRTITFQVERKGKVREEVVGIDDQTYIERIIREKVTLKDLKEGDQIYLRYEPDAYTPALSVQIIGKGMVK